MRPSGRGSRARHDRVGTGTGLRPRGPTNRAGKATRTRFFVFALLLVTGAANLYFPEALAAAEGRSDVATTTYTVNPGAGRIDVVVDLTVKNTTPNTVEYVTCTDWYYDPYLGYYPVTYSCPQTTRFYLNDAYVWLERGAKNFKVSANAGAAKIALYKPGEGFDAYKITFSRIFRGQSRKVRLTYQIPSGAPRSDSTTRVGKAFVSFCATANGIDRGSTKVVVPARYELQVEASGGLITPSTSDGLTTYETGSLSSPPEFWACFSGDDPAAYTASTFLSPSGRAIKVQAWPEDSAWNTAVTDQLGEALSELELLMGRDLPGTGSIIVREVSASELGSYAGTFDADAGVARIGEDYSQQGVVAHELAHAWFNGELFDARWLSEGSAGWAESVVTGNPCRDPGAAPREGTALTDWTFAGPKATLDELAAVAYQYDASCYLVSTIFNRIGPERAPQVLAALFDREGAYRSAATVLPEHAGALDWRDWLDAVDELGLSPAGLTDLDYAQGLLLEFGVTNDSSILAARTSARAAYHAFVASAEGWQMPVAILRPLEAWSFDEATTALTSGTNAYAAAVRVNEILPEAGATDGPVKELFESAQTVVDLQDAERRALDQEAAATAVSAAQDALAAPRDLFAQIGLLGTDLAPDLAAGVAAVQAADLIAAEAKASLIALTLGDADEQGMLRVALLLAALLLLIGLLLVTRHLRRSGRGPRVAALALGSLGSGLYEGGPGSFMEPHQGVVPSAQPIPGDPALTSAGPAHAATQTAGEVVAQEGGPVHGPGT